VITGVKFRDGIKQEQQDQDAAWYSVHQIWL
jgi:hypothetical protein